MLDPRLGRWLTIDPLSDKQPSQTPFKAMLNNTNVYSDPNGQTEYETIVFYHANGNYLFKAYKKISSNLMSGGDYDDEDGANYSAGYDYRHVTEVTIQNDGSIVMRAKRETEILEENGVKDFEYFIFAKKEGVIYNCDIPTLEGSGGKQDGGWTLTSGRGGASPTKQKSLNPAEEKEIGDLLTYFGAGNQSPYKDLPKSHEAWKEFFDKSKGVMEETIPNTTASDKEQKTIIISSPEKSQSGGTTPLTWKGALEEAQKQNYGELSPNKDTFYIKKQ